MLFRSVPAGAEVLLLLPPLLLHAESARAAAAIATRAVAGVSFLVMCLRSQSSEDGDNLMSYGSPVKVPRLLLPNSDSFMRRPSLGPDAVRLVPITNHL